MSNERNIRDIEITMMRSAPMIIKECNGKRKISRKLIAEIIKESDRDPVLQKEAEITHANMRKFLIHRHKWRMLSNKLKEEKILPDERPELKHMDFKSKRCYYEKRIAASIDSFMKRLDELSHTPNNNNNDFGNTCCHCHPSSLNWSEEENEIIDMEKSCHYDVSQKIVIDKNTESIAVNMMCVFDQGCSYKKEDERRAFNKKIQENTYDDGEECYIKNGCGVAASKLECGTCESDEHTLMDKSGISHGALWITRCKFGHYQRGCNVFCLKCLAEEKRTIRIHGCNVRNCYANKSFRDLHKNDDKDILRKAVCCHMRSFSDECVYSMTPIAHIVMLTNAGLDDRIIHSTRTALLSVVEECKKNKVTCPSCSYNTAYVFSFLGETVLTESICSLYRGLFHPKAQRDTLKSVIETITGDSIEKRQYFGNTKNQETVKVSSKSTVSKKTTVNGNRLTSMKHSGHSGRVIKLTEKIIHWGSFEKKRVSAKKSKPKSTARRTEIGFKSRVAKRSGKPSKISLPLLSKKDLLNLKKDSYGNISLPNRFDKSNIGPTIELFKDLRDRYDGSRVSYLMDPLPYVMETKPVPVFYFSQEEMDRISRSCDQEHQLMTGKTESVGESDEKVTVSFYPPKRGSVVDRFINYRLRADGIVCNSTSLMNESFYEISLEVINCSEVDREQPYMSCHGLLFPKGKGDKNERISIGKVIGFEMIDFYLKIVSITGKSGVYIKKYVSSSSYVWYHWRWFISSVVCDMVAQEELEGCSGKRATTFPCLYCNSCQRLRLGVDTYGLQQIQSPVAMSDPHRLIIIGQSLDFLHPNSMYRCSSIIYNWDKGVDFSQFLKDKGVELSDEQKSEVKSLQRLFSLFPKDSFHQYLPIALSPYDWIRYRIQIIKRVIPSFLQADDSEIDDGKDLYSQNEKRYESVETESVHESRNEENEDRNGNEISGSENEDKEENGSVGSLCESEDMVVAEMEDRSACETVDSIESECFDNEGEDMSEVDIADNGGERMRVDSSEIVEGKNGNTDENQLDERDVISGLVDSSPLRDPERDMIVKELSSNANLEKIVGKVDEPDVYNKVLQLEKNIPVPSEYREGVDAMHNIYNICKLFISIINNDYSFSASFNSSFDEYVKKVLFGDTNKAPCSWTLSPDFSDVLTKAKSRRQELSKKLPFCSLIVNDLLRPSFFTTVSDHDDMLFIFCFYHYLFQDSLDIPVIFLFKVIFDYLSYFFNFNGDLNELIVNQLNYDVIVGLLQGELAPSILTISLHNSCHYDHSIILQGYAANTNCFLSERSYKVIKRNILSSPCPHKTGGKRFVVSMMARSFANNVVETKWNDVSCSGYVSIDTVNVECEDGSYSTVTINTPCLEEIIKVNAYEDALYYKDSSYSRNTYVDIMLESGSGLDTVAIDDVIQYYRSLYSENIDNICVTSTSSLEVYRSFCIRRKVTIPDSLFDDNHCLDHRRIAMTRSYKGETILLWVIGFVSHIVNNHSYCTALCIRIPTESGSSFIHTCHYGFIKWAEFLDSLKRPSIIPVSVYRLHFDVVCVYRYKESYSFSVLKLCHRQYMLLRKYEGFVSFLGSNQA